MFLQCQLIASERSNIKIAIVCAGGGYSQATDGYVHSNSQGNGVSYSNEHRAQRFGS